MIAVYLVLSVAVTSYYITYLIIYILSYTCPVNFLFTLVDEKKFEVSFVKSSILCKHSRISHCIHHQTCFLKCCSFNRGNPNDCGETRTSQIWNAFVAEDSVSHSLSKQASLGWLPWVCWILSPPTKATDTAETRQPHDSHHYHRFFAAKSTTKAQLQTMQLSNNDNPTSSQQRSITPLWPHQTWTTRFGLW